MPAAPLINGVNYSWANITLVLFGVPVIGITKIDYKRKQKKDNNYGTGTEPISRGFGNVEYEGMIEIYQDEWRKIIAAAPLKDPLLIPPFPIQIVFGGDRVSASNDSLLMCEFTEDSMTTGQGDSKILISIPLIIGGIVHA